MSALGDWNLNDDPDDQELEEDMSEGEDSSPGPYYATLDDFVTQQLAPLYRPLPGRPPPHLVP